MIYIVLGMHKSGTTLISQILNESTIDMGSFDPAIGYDQGNKYERESTLTLNEKILGAENQESILIDFQQQMDLDREHRQQMQEIIKNENAKHENWGFKDPRMCLTYNLWLPELPEHRIVAIFRSPHESWSRYKRVYSNLKAPIRAWQYISSWTQHNHNILQVLKNTSCEYVLLEYTALMHTQEEFERLQAFVGMPLVDKRNMKMYRNKDRNHAIINLYDNVLKVTKNMSANQIYKDLHELRNAQINQ